MYTVYTNNYEDYQKVFFSLWHPVFHITTQCQALATILNIIKSQVSRERLWCFEGVRNTPKYHNIWWHTNATHIHPTRSDINILDSLPGETGDIADTGDTGGPLGGLVTSCRGETRSVTYKWRFEVFGRGSFSCQTCDIAGKVKVILVPLFLRKLMAIFIQFHPIKFQQKFSKMHRLWKVIRIVSPPHVEVPLQQHARHVEPPRFGADGRCCDIQHPPRWWMEPEYVHKENGAWNHL